MRLALMSRFSPSVLRCLGAATIEASMIWPLIAKNPAAESATSKRSNRASIAGFPASWARVSASRTVQIVLASGTVSARSSPRKRINDSRSRIRACPGAGVSSRDWRDSARLWQAVCFLRERLMPATAQLVPVVHRRDPRARVATVTRLAAGAMAAALTAGKDSDWGDDLLLEPPARIFSRN